MVFHTILWENIKMINQWDNTNFKTIRGFQWDINHLGMLGGMLGGISLKN